MLRSKSRYSALDETAFMGAACRHERPIPCFFNLKHGERYMQSECVCVILRACVCAPMCILYMHMCICVPCAMCAMCNVCVCIYITILRMCGKMYFHLLKKII